MNRLSAAAQNVLANLGYRVEEGEDVFHACYLGAGAGVPPVAWVRSEDGGWQAAIAKHVVPRLANESLTQSAAAGHCPAEAAFVVSIPDRDRLYGVFELIATACMRRSARTRADGPAATEVAEPLPSPAHFAAFDRLLDEAELDQIPPETVVRALHNMRVGQNRFRAALLAHWGNACAVTGLSVPRLLRASHCKPWAVSSAHERLDPNNGLLLAAHLDAAFDTGYISFADDGTMLCSLQLSVYDREVLGLRGDLRLRQVQASYLPYIHWHRTHVFLGSVSTKK